MTNPEKRSVKCNDREIEYLLTRKSVKNINLRIKPDGMVCVSANKRIPSKYIDNFIVEKQIFIITALEKYKQRVNVAPAPKQYITGESFKLLGKTFELKVYEGNRESVTVEGEHIFLTVRDINDFKRKESLVNKWQREMQEAVFTEICRDTYRIFQKYNLKYPTIKIRKMKSRWGSCQPQKCIITLNSRLIEAPGRCIEYVVVHEFAHFIHPDHSKAFYEFVGEIMPDWKVLRKELKGG